MTNSHVEPMDFRRALGGFATGVTVITTVTASGEIFGMTAISFNSVSLDPPLILFSLAKNADCYEAFRSSERFAVSILSSAQQQISTQFATKDIDKWDGVAFELGADGCPIIDGVLAAFECDVDTRHPGGDHDIYVGQVRHVHSSMADEASPLLFFRGAYAALSAR